MKRPQVKDLKQGVTVYKVHGLGFGTYISRLFITQGPRPYRLSTGKEKKFAAVPQSTYYADGISRPYTFREPRVDEFFVGDCGLLTYARGIYRANYTRVRWTGTPVPKGHALFFTLKDAVRYAQSIVNDPVQVLIEEERHQSLMDYMDAWERDMDDCSCPSCDPQHGDDPVYHPSSL